MTQQQYTPQQLQAVAQQQSVTFSSPQVQVTVQQNQTLLQTAQAFQQPFGQLITPHVRMDYVCLLLLKIIKSCQGHYIMSFSLYI